MLRRCPVGIFRALYLSTTAAAAFRPKGTEANTPVLQRLSAVVEKRGKETGKFLAGPFQAACSFALIEVL